jgi:chemotaxis protein histidine kinase CheA
MGNELLNEFIYDSRDHLGTAGAQLLDLEKNPGSLTAINALMGTLHTIKGNSGFLDLQNLYKLMHHAESLLQTLRETQCPCPSNMIDLLLQVLDTVEALLTRLENGDDDLVDWLDALNQALSEAEVSLEDASRVAGVGEMADSDANDAAEQEASPDENPAGSRAAETSVEIKENVEGTIKTVIIEDGRLASETAAFPAYLEALFKAGLKGLLLDMRQLASISGSELQTIRQIGKKYDGRVAFILDQARQDSLLRVFSILNLDRSLKLFSDEAAAAAFLDD